MRMAWVIVCCWLCPGGSCGAADAAPARLRLMIETDAGGDPDDEQSLVRFLLYVNEWDVEGILANRPQAVPGENLNPERTGLGVVRQLVRAYGECYPHLVQHDDRFPRPEQLLSVTLPAYDDVDDGVRRILEAVDGPDPRPLWFCNWGTIQGAATSSLQRALDRVLAERGPQGYAAFKRRLRLSSDDQFGRHTYEQAPPFPLWIDTFRPWPKGQRWYHRFSRITATAGGFDLERDARNGHGPLGALYPTNTTHRQKEGDSMTFLYLVPTGMNDPDQPTWGSWAGRYGHRQDQGERAYYWANQADTWRGATHRDLTLERWAEDLQNDFRARLDWCVQPPAAANHPPRPQVAGTLARTVVAGDTVELDATSSSDPDGHTLAYEWLYYAEPGSYRGPLSIEGHDRPRASLVAPPVDRPQTLHVVLRVSDSGVPRLARYRRLVLTVAPRGG
jgi:hypothetical protein